MPTWRQYCLFYLFVCLLFFYPVSLWPLGNFCVWAYILECSVGLCRVWVCAHACIRVSAARMSEVKAACFHRTSSSYLICDQDPSLTLQSTIPSTPAGQWAPGTPVPTPKIWNDKCEPLHLAFPCGCCGSHLWSSALLASTSLARLSPWLWRYI